MKSFSVLEFVAHLKMVERDVQRLGPEIIRHAANAVCARAKALIGTYDAEPQWAQLSAATIADRVKKGYAANEPLLRTGEMRDSIGITSAPSGFQAWVGSNNDKAVWHELGTSRAPPRPFLASAAIELEPKIHRAAARATMAVMAGRGLMSAEFRELMELLHLAKETAQYAKEQVVDPLFEHNETREKRR